jgi:septation ring formation regulator EzrA
LYNSSSSKIKDNFNYDSINNNIKNKIVHINKEIIALQTKLKNLNQDNANYEKKSFEIQEKINELYAKRYAILSNT